MTPPGVAPNSAPVPRLAEPNAEQPVDKDSARSGITRERRRGFFMGVLRLKRVMKPNLCMADAKCPD